MKHKSSRPASDQVADVARRSGRKKGLARKIADRLQLEEEIGSRQARLGMVLEAAGMVTWEWDIPAGSIRYSNNIAAIVRGEAVEPYCSMDTLLDEIHPEDRERLVQSLEDTRKTGNPWECEYRARMVDGTYRWILGKGKIVVLKGGKPVRVLGMSLDIHERKEAEERVRQSETRIRLLAESAGRLLATCDPRGEIKQVCREAMAYLDCQVFFHFLREESPGPPGAAAPGSGTIPRLHLNACAGISDEEARQIEWLDFGEAVCGCVARDGRRIVAEHIQRFEDPRTAMARSYGVSAYCCHPLFNAGRVIGTLSFGTTTRPSFTVEEVELMRVISDLVAMTLRRLNSLEALERARAEALNDRNRLAAVMETLPVGVCILDAQGGIVRVNAAYKELWGGPLPPVRGVSDYAAYEACWAATGKPLQPEEWASARAVQHGETVVNQELQIKRFDDTRAFVLNSAAPIRDVDGRIVGCAVAIRDITDHKQAEELNRQLELQVQQAQKEESLGVLAGGIAHDFNNLLSVIVGNTGLALAELTTDSPARPLLGRVEESSRRAADLCQQMLAYVGKTPLAFCPVQLNQFIQQNMERLIAAALSKNVRLRWNLAPQLPLVHADPGRIRQITMNLLINASEAIGDRPGQVTVTTGSAPCRAIDLESPWIQDPLRPGNYVFLEVADTGCGIDSALLPRLFDPFFSTKFTGRGLGLAAVLGIIRSHHGTIQVQSDPGRGSRFRVWLPAAGRPTTSEPIDRPVQDWHGSGTVLVVDDEEALRATAQAMLETLGFQTVAAEDGLEAIEIYRANPERFCCILLDATMPNLDGEATFQELFRICPSVQVVLSSGYARDEIMARFQGCALAGFLQKPYTLKDLSAALQRLTAPAEAR